MTASWYAQLGWSEALETAARPLRTRGLVMARVSHVYRMQLKVLTPEGERWAETGGRIRHHADSIEALPTVGDWVAARMAQGPGDALVTHVLPRKSAVIRKEPGQTVAPQLLCANLDTALVMMGLDQDFNLRRLERFLAVAFDSKARPVVALNKADRCDDVPALLAEVAQVAPEVTVLPMSAKTGEGLAELLPFLGPGQTVGLLGSSGVGKSTLLNRVLGIEVMETGETRDDGRGRHTTTRRELVRIPNGGCVIDTPGLREVQLWEAQSGIAKAFDDVEAFAEQCKFGNCQHDAEPACAVKAALESGALSDDRYEAWVQLHAELATVGVRGPGVSKRRERVGKGRRR